MHFSHSIYFMIVLVILDYIVGTSGYHYNRQSVSSPPHPTPHPFFLLRGTKCRKTCLISCFYFIKLCFIYNSSIQLIRGSGGGGVIWSSWYWQSCKFIYSSNNLVVLWRSNLKRTKKATYCKCEGFKSKPANDKYVQLMCFFCHYIRGGSRNGG